MRLSLKISLPVLLLTVTTWAQHSTRQKASRYDFSSVQHTIQGWVDSGYYSGASIIIVKDKKVAYRDYFGNYAPQTVTFIASAGKWLAAATIAAVVDEGKLNWNDKVNKWLPEFTDNKGNASLAQLLSHTAGYPDYQPSGKRPDNYQTLNESVSQIVSLPADTLPGTLFKYGGLAMQVAGRMAELATGMSWEALFQLKIAGPLKMHLTHFIPVDETPGHNPMIGGGARTCLQDYANFLSMILNNGEFGGKRILSGNAVKLLESDHVGNAIVHEGEFVEKVRGGNRKDIYGLGEWREETDAGGNATLISSPSWAGTYPWIDRKNNVYGLFLARVNVEIANKNGFSSFYSSAVLPLLVRNSIRITDSN